MEPMDEQPFWTYSDDRELWCARPADGVELYIGKGIDGAWEAWLEAPDIPGVARRRIEGSIEEAQQAAEQMYIDILGTSRA
jgi:hypothetical protein